MKKYSDKETKEYYDSFTPIYLAFWGEQIHTGYYDKPKSSVQATQDMNVHLANMSNLKSNRKLLEVGSGMGVFSRWLTEKYHLDVSGIDISGSQIRHSKQKAEERNLDIEYKIASMINIPFLENSFHYIWAQQSFWFCHDKLNAVKEFFRVLKNGGLIILEDTILLDKKYEEEVREKFLYRLPINTLSTKEELIEMFVENGFELLKSEDLTVHLEVTYTEITKMVKKNLHFFREKVHPKFKNRIDNLFGFPESEKLTRERKLGNYFFLFRKK